MTNAPARFTQADISRAIKAVQATGANMRIRVTPDSHILIEPNVNQETTQPVAKKGRISL